VGAGHGAVEPGLVPEYPTWSEDEPPVDLSKRHLPKPHVIQLVRSAVETIVETAQRRDPRLGSTVHEAFLSASVGAKACIRAANEAFDLACLKDVDADEFNARGAELVDAWMAAVRMPVPA
jgi:hypothetical protein